MTIDKQRVAAVAALEALGFSYSVGFRPSLKQLRSPPRPTRCTRSLSRAPTILRRVRTGKVTFWSVMPYSKNIRKLAPDNLEEE